MASHDLVYIEPATPPFKGNRWHVHDSLRNELIIALPPESFENETEGILSE